MLYSVSAQVSFVALVAVTLFVLWAGDRWGRWSALLHAANWGLVALLQKRHQAHLVFQTGDFIADVLGGALAILIAVRSRRAWAGSLAAFQLLGVVNYLVVYADARVLHRAFWTLQYVWEGGAILSLAWAGAAGLTNGADRRWRR